jgi:hypothetical protein
MHEVTFELKSSVEMYFVLEYTSVFGGSHRRVVSQGLVEGTQQAVANPGSSVVRVLE